MDFSRFFTKLHINAIICSLALTYLSTLLILHGDRCAGASLAASIATLAIAFAQQGNDHGAPKEAPESLQEGIKQIPSD